MSADDFSICHSKMTKKGIEQKSPEGFSKLMYDLVSSPPLLQNIGRSNIRMSGNSKNH